LLKGTGSFFIFKFAHPIIYPYGMKYILFAYFFCISIFASGQTDTTIPVKQTDTTLLPAPIGYQDTALRITNVNPYFTLHVDSILNYDFIINKNPADYYWFLTNSPVGVKIDRKTGVLYVKGEKALFKNGRLKYDVPYRVQLGVQNLHNPTERVDTAFTLLFYSTEIIVSRLKPTTSSVINLEEGDSVQFRIQCEEGTFPFEQISVNSTIPLSNFTPVSRCDDQFKWVVPFGMFKENDTAKQKTVTLEFVGSDKFFNRDTAVVKVIIKPGINYPVRNQQHQKEIEGLKTYIKRMKLTFAVVSEQVKKNKKTRTFFDIGSSSTALAGTIISTTADPNTKAEDVGKILPSVGLTLIPIKEGVAPNKVQQQNTASQIRGEVRRLEYVVEENVLSGERDLEVLTKTKRLREELKKSMLQFADLPMVEFDSSFSEEEADKYFNNPKVIKKYKFSVR
jgi:hypothetical protein